MTDLSHKTVGQIRQWYEERSHRADGVYANPMAQQRMRTIKGLLEPLIEGASVLDIGCGLGQYAVWMAENGADEVLAVDIAQATLDRAPRHAKVSYLRSAWEELPDVGHFDLALCTETIEHSTDPAALVALLHSHADTVVASVPISEGRDNIGWTKQGHLHTFRTNTFHALFEGKEGKFGADSHYAYVVAR